jgi:hypothetical protein
VSQPAGEHEFLYGDCRTDNHKSGTEDILHKSIMCSVKGPTFLEMGFHAKILSGRTWDIITPNVYSPKGDKCYNMNEKFRVKIVLGNCNSKVDK